MEDWRRRRRPSRRRWAGARAAALVAGAAAIAAPGIARASTLPYPTRCGVELSRPLAATSSGPVCGTDEGDDVFFAGEPSPIQFYGENGHDTVSGSFFADGLVGGGGNDELHGDRGDDAIDGGDDSDLLFGGPGDDSLRERRFGFDRLYGGPGNDTLAGGRAGDRLYGGPGNDVLYGGSGGDRLFGGPGDDVLYGGPNRDSFDCGPGNDTVYRVRRSTGPSSLDRGDSFIPRAAGCERIVEGDPTATFPLRGVVGSNANDVLTGSDEPDLLEGKGASDKLVGGAGDDELEGDGASNQGADTLLGGAGNDRIAGRAGDDRLFGDTTDAAGPSGHDEIVGGAGRDLLVGGGGNDALAGAYDGDRILAGSGDDVVSLLGGDTTDPSGTAYVDCGPGADLVVINPARRGTYRNCEHYADQWHEADWGALLRPSPEVFPPGAEPAAAAGRDARAGRAARARASARSRAAVELTPATQAEPDGGAGPPSISDDGTRVAFSSDAANLLADDSNGERTDPFVRDLQTGITTAADSVGRGLATHGGRFRRGPSGAVSGDGRFVAFSSRSSDLGRTGSGYRIWVRDLSDGSTRIACRPGNAAAENPVISADGRRVAFESLATDLAGSDVNQQVDVYWCDLASGELRRVSTPLQDGVNSSGSSQSPAISADGRYVAFTSDAGGLVAGDGGRAGVYWKDMESGSIAVVDVAPGAAAANGTGSHPRISNDGQYVVFDSDATDVPGGDHNGRLVDVFRKHVLGGTVDLISAAPGGASADSAASSISGDGNVVGFSSAAANLVEGDANGTTDAFTRNLATGAITRVSTRSDGTELSGPSYAAAVSGTGRFVAFASRAPDAVRGTAASARARVYRKDVFTGELVLASVGLNLAPRTRIDAPLGVLPRRKARVIEGTADDDGAVGRVDVGMSRSIGRGRCLWLGRDSRVLRRPCRRPVWVAARLDNGLHFALTIRRLLPRGTWRLRTRATDQTGKREPARPGTNAVRLRLR